MNRFLIYLIRWQLSTPILALCLWLLSPLGIGGATVVANLIGAIIMYPVDRFFFVDKRIFKEKE